MKRPAGCALGVGLGLVFSLGMIAAFGAVLSVIWPGVFELTAPILCPDGFADPLVVRDTYSVQPGETSTTFTMYCLSPRGEVHDAGALKPMLLVMAGLVVICTVVGLIAMMLVGRSAVRRRARRGRERPEPAEAYVASVVPNVIEVRLVEVDPNTPAPVGEVFPTPPPVGDGPEAAPGDRPVT